MVDMMPLDWDDLLSKATQRVFPKTPEAQPEGMETAAARRLWRTTQLASDADLSACMDQDARHAQHRHAAKQARQNRAAQFLSEVDDQAIATGDQHFTYQTLKQLRPSQPAQKLNSRTRMAACRATC